MSDIMVRKVTDRDDRSLPVFTEIDEVMAAIGRRARELFDLRGGFEGHALDDWLQAEHEICWPAAELLERDKDFEVSIALAGYEPHDIELTATPSELIVHATVRREHKETKGEVRWSEFHSSDVYKRIDLPVTIDVSHVKATLKHGLLKIIAPKKVVAVVRKPVEVPVAA